MPGLSHFLAGFIAHYGIPALFISVSLESLGAPLPGETAIIVASGAAAAGKLDITAVAIAAFLAAVVGDNTGYLIGRKLGRPVITRYGARVGLTDKNFDRVEAITRKYGPLMVVFARFVVVLRQLNGIVAGTTRMPWPTFLLANATGAALWVGVWTTLAYRFGHSTDDRALPLAPPQPRRRDRRAALDRGARPILAPAPPPDARRRAERLTPSCRCAASPGRRRRRPTCAGRSSRSPIMKPTLITWMMSPALVPGTGASNIAWCSLGRSARRPSG